MDHGTLNNLSKVSKYYRSIAEPYLYRHFSFWTRQKTNIRWLFLTIVSRPDLAAHIRSCKLVEFGRHIKGEALDTGLDEIFCEMFQQLKSIVLDILGPNAPPELISNWVIALVRPDYFEGCLAYILFRAVSIESLDLGQLAAHEDGSLIARITPYAYRNGSSTNPTPFTKLKDLRSPFRAIMNIPHLPSLESMQISSWVNSVHGESIIFLQGDPNGWKSGLADSAKIHTLVLHDVGVLPSSLCEILQQKRLNHLRSLTLHDAFDPRLDDYQEVVETLRDHCPYLKCLEWLRVDDEGDDYNPQPELKPLQGLRELRSLTILRLDAGFLVDLDQSQDLRDPLAILPPNLESLHLSGVHGWYLRLNILSYARNFIDFVQSLARLNHLQRFSIALQESQVNVGWFGVSPALEIILRNIQGSLLTVGTEFMVFMKPLGEYELILCELNEAKDTPDD
ncbi:Nn.00g032730.m01.CDS01 [Neocucurbitaria sp. VM-36]